MLRSVQNDRRQRAGFALLITIVLVAFLVLVLVSLASLTRVETRVASNAQTLGMARQNALFSLNLALGRLQEYAGPDSRLTARSDITSQGPAFQPYLTGVWNRSNTTNTPDAWLVSGAADNPVDIADVLDPAQGDTVYAKGADPWVFLLGDASVDDPAQRVRMATRAIDVPAGSVPGLDSAATVGRYAWWIGDEGVKASAAMVDPLLLPNPISYDSGGTTGDDWSDAVKRARLNQLQPVRPRLERLFTGLSPDDAATAAELRKVSQFSQIGLVTNGPDQSTRKAAFHAVTPLAEAVLLDHFNSSNHYSYLPGGTSRLRIDLSDPACPVYTGNKPPIQGFANLRASIPDADKPYEAVYNPIASLPAGAKAFPALHAGPVLTEFGFRIFFTVDDDTNEIILNYLVEAELWNPYAARLEMERLGSGTTDKPLSIYIDTGLEVTVKDANDVEYDKINVTKLIVDANGRGGTDDDDSYGVLIDVQETWQPGEIRILSGSTTLSDGGMGGSIGTRKFVSSGAKKIVSITRQDVPTFDLYLRLNEQSGKRPKEVQHYFPKLVPPPTEGDPTPPSFNAFSDLNNDPDAGYACGFGFNLTNNWWIWLQDSGNGLDIRCPKLEPNNAVKAPVYATATSGTKRWSANPSDNATVSPDGVFVNLAQVVLYDIPRQELVSVGDLRQLSGEKNAELGSGHAGAVNQWFDRYFFSTIPRNHAWNFVGGEPLPNRYLRYVPSERAEATLDKLRAYDKSARFLLQRGSFNINSTSVDAWRMMLGQHLADWKGVSTEGEPDDAMDLDNVFLRLPHGAQQLTNEPVAAGSAPSNVVAATTGGRRLTPVEIDKMARAIVQNLKNRGYPFPALQPLLSSGGSTVRPFYAAASWVDPVAFPSSGTRRISCLPGVAVSPADIAAVLAPVMTTRSDTFLIRAYGDARNTVTGDVEGRAWCEAVVQRVPDVTDPVTGSWVEGDEVTISTTKYPFGRKFKIVSFRWLNAEDV